jgi:hypothetical protein
MASFINALTIISTIDIIKGPVYDPTHYRWPIHHIDSMMGCGLGITIIDMLPLP